MHVILVSGRGKGFCGGYDLSLYAEGADAEPPDSKRDGTVLDPRVQTRNHVPGDTWDPAVDYMMMSRFNRGFASLMRADKPTVAKLHGFCVAGGTDIALHADQIITATDTKIGYPPTRVWGVPSTGLWAHRLGDQRAKRLLLTGDCITGAQAADWGLAAEAVDPAHLDEATESLCGRIAALPINQLVMTKLALNTALNSQAIANSAAISTLADERPVTPARAIPSPPALPRPDSAPPYANATNHSVTPRCQRPATIQPRPRRPPSDAVAGCCSTWARRGRLFLPAAVRARAGTNMGHGGLAAWPARHARETVTAVGGRA